MNTEYALDELVSDGILIYSESGGDVWYAVNPERLSEAQEEMDADESDENTNTNAIVQPFIPEPKGFKYWFKVPETRKFRKQSIYRIYKKHTDSFAFAAQLVKITGINTIHVGSLSNPQSFISRLWRAISLIVKEKKGGIFILQDVQNKDIEACGNARQRGKVALKIFCKLGYIHERGVKGVSTLYSSGEKRPFNMTLDNIIYPKIQYKNSEEVNDPERYGEEKVKEKITDIYDDIVSKKLYDIQRNDNNDKT